VGGEGEVDPAWPSVDAASVVGAAAVGGVPSDAAGVAAARSVRRALPAGGQAKARELLGPVQREIDATDKDLQKALLKLIGDFGN
jgi:hypothetical protein